MEVDKKFLNFLMLKFILLCLGGTVAFSAHISLLFWVFLYISIYLVTTGWVQYYALCRLENGKDKVIAIIAVSFLIELAIHYFVLFNGQKDMRPHLVLVTFNMVLFLLFFRKELKTLRT